MMKARNATRPGLIALAALCAVCAHGGVIYTDTFQDYPAQSPAPSPLTNGPAGGQWFYVDPTPPTIGANEHRIFNATAGGSGLNSRCWVSSHNDAKITNAIAIPALPAVSPCTFTLSFVAAAETSDAGRPVTFGYEIGSSGGALQFVMGGNMDYSQALTALSGFAVASGGTKGKADDRKFQIVFTGTGLTTADRIYVSLQRITNAGAAGAFLAIDDVSLALDMGAPAAVENPASVTANAGESVTFTGVFRNFPDTYQWYKNDVPIDGATSASYTIPFVTKPDEGSYVLAASNNEGMGSTLPALLTVNDSAAPALASAQGLLTLEHARIRFSEPVDEASATNPAHYAVSGGIAVSNAILADRFTVELHTSVLSTGATHTVTVSGVQDLAANTIPAGSTIDFHTPALVISAAGYYAGAAGTHPQGPSDPASAAGGYWMMTTNLNPSMVAGGVADDLGTGLHAWAVSDQNAGSGGGILDYRLAIDSASDDLARANGWRLLCVSRMLPNGAGSCPVVLYSHPGVTRRYGIAFSVNANMELTAQLLEGETYALPGDPFAYRAHVIVFDPATTNASYYCDGQLIAANYAGGANAVYNGLVFGAGSSPNTGDMNFHRVQLDVVGGTQPAVVAHPQSSTNGVGQRITFAASFTPFVAAYQWLLNNVPIPGAVSNSFTTDYITLGMDGSQYRCRALHALGSVETDAAVLTVTSDTTPPEVVSVRGSWLLDRVLIGYSEPVLEAQATNILNYVWESSGVTNLSARRVDPFTVELRTTPQQAGSQYTLRISNIRDTSSLPIAGNTPAIFKTARLATLARYDAGTPATHPSGPPDPATPEGGSWTASIGTDPSLITGPVYDDFGTGLHAWQVTDQTTAGSQFIQYSMPLTAEQQQAAWTNGWVMTVRSRFADDFSSSSSVMSQLGIASGSRVLLWYDLDAAGALVVTPQGSSGITLTEPGFGAAEYHLHQVVFDPATARATYYFDGREVLAGWAGDVSAYAYHGVQWGTGSSANQGSMHFNQVEFKVVEAPVRPHLSMLLRDGNVDVYYTGILEATSSLGNNVAWTAIATNQTPQTNVFSIPAVGQQFYRAKSSE